jgi:hypothetical protein
LEGHHLCVAIASIHLLHFWRFICQYFSLSITSL